MDMSLSTDASSSSSSTHPVQGSSSSAAFASPSVLGKKRLHADETEETEKSLSKREKCDPVSTTSSSSTTNSTATTPAVTTTSSSSLSASTEETKNTNNNRVTENGVTRIIHREKDLRPILYLVQVQDSQDKKRKQGLISDGHLCIEFYTAEILKKEFEKQQLNVYSVVQLKNFLYNPKDSLKKVYIQTIGFISGPTALSGPVSVVNVSEAEGKLVVRPGRLFPLPAFPTASPSSGSSSSSFSAASLGLSAFASSSFASSSSSSSAASTKRTAPPIKQEQKSKQLTLPSEASPISSLHTGRTSFMIKAWVDSLSEPKTFNTNGRPGMLAKVILRDESGRISATLWNDDVNRFAAMLKLDHCYYFSFVSGSVKNVNAKFRGTVQCDYELSMNSQTVVQPVVEEEKETKKHKPEFQFVPIATLSTLMERASVLNIPAYVDLLGVVTAEPGTPIQFKAKKTGKDVTKQTLTLIDRSKSSVDITFFHGRPLGLHVGDIVAFKKVKMTSYSGVSLTFSDESRLYINSGDVAGTPELRKWYNHHKQGLNEAASLTTRQKTERKNTLGEMDTLDFDFKVSALLFCFWFVLCFVVLTRTKKRKVHAVMLNTLKFVQPLLKSLAQFRKRAKRENAPMNDAPRIRGVRFVKRNVNRMHKHVRESNASKKTRRFQVRHFILLSSSYWSMHSARDGPRPLIARLRYCLCLVLPCF